MLKYPKTNHSQTAIEFLILIGVALFFSSAFFLAIQESSADKIKEKQNRVVFNTALSVLDEINLASKASNGYSREFDIPEKIGNQDYEILITENLLYIRTTDAKNALSISVPNVSGNVLKGSNVIKKENNTVKIN